MNKEFDEYIRQGEPLARQRSYAWQTAIGLQAVDGLKPSEYLSRVNKIRKMLPAMLPAKPCLT